MSNIKRRTFISTAGAATVAGLATGLAGAADLKNGTGAEPGATFNLKYAPHFGMFDAISGGDHLEQLRFASEQGFRAWEDNGMPGRYDEEQKRIGDEMKRLEI